LRAVASLEALKGIMVLLLGLGLLRLLHKNAETVAEDLLIHFHINPDMRLSHALLNAADRITDARLWGIAAAAAVYALVRFVEAWGLWWRRVWAEWFAILSGALYLPWEILKVSERPNALHLALLFCNVSIVGYMVFIRARASPDYNRTGED
jgi:uncharacterized membrane protein (DUF2068 family)